MYKVFFNERTIFLTDEFTRNFGIKQGLFYKFSNAEELKELVFFYSSVEKIGSLYIFHYDIDYLRDIFRDCFRQINAAGGLIRNKQGEYLFIMRRGKWDLPKGKLDPDESFQKAAIREAREECGLENLSIVTPMLSTYHTYDLDKDLVLKKTCWFEMLYTGNSKPVPEAEEDITEIRWFKKEDISIVVENTYQTISDVLRYAGLIKL
jgi:8-oxo-dGTP pyrophosphatase MutT (NUDIX family)